jgi:acetyltransferase
MKELFSPSTIAVIGANESEGKVGNTIFRNLLAAGKHVYPVNPYLDYVLGVRSFARVTEIVERVDLAVLAVPAEVVPSVLLDCGKKGVRFAIVIASGFSEAGRRSLEEKVKKIGKRYKLRILGPNCLGVINPRENLNTTFYDKTPSPGGIGFISQSGALGVMLLDLAIAQGLGFSKFVSLGNACDLDFPELIRYLARDSETKVIALYIEYLRDGREFMRACLQARKPIIVLKAGRTSSGLRASISHVAAIATEDKIYSAAFKQVGAIRVKSIEELFELALAMERLGYLRGKRACIVTNAGGLGVIASDACDEHGLKVPELPKALIKKFNKVLPKAWSKNNPIDLMGDARAEHYRKVFELLKKEDFFDFLLCILTPQAMAQPERTAQELIKFRDETSKPCFACFLGGAKVRGAIRLLRQNAIPYFDEPDDFARVVSQMVIR